MWRLLLQSTSHSIDGYSLNYMAEMHEWVSATPIWREIIDCTVKRLATQFHMHHWMATHYCTDYVCVCMLMFVWVQVRKSFWNWYNKLCFEYAACSNWNMFWHTVKGLLSVILAWFGLLAKIFYVLFPILYWFGSTQARAIKPGITPVITYQYCRITYCSVQNQNMRMDSINSRQQQWYLRRQRALQQTNNGTLDTKEFKSSKSVNNENNF